MAALARTALDMWYSREHDTVTLSTGCAPLDGILHGGFRSGLLTELCGEAGAGKTQVCLQLLLQSCLPRSLGGLGGTACYISTEGLSSIKRLHDIAGVYQQRYSGVLRKRRRDESEGGVASAFMDNIFIEQIYEVAELVEFMQARLPTLLSEHNTKLVIIDSVAAAFRLESTASVKEASDRSRLMFHLANCMRILSAQFQAVFVVTNQVTGNVTEGVSFTSRANQHKPALGLSWSNCINQRLMLYRTGRGGERRVEVVLSPYLPRETASFLITTAGITSVEARE